MNTKESPAYPGRDPDPCAAPLPNPSCPPSRTCSPAHPGDDPQAVLRPGLSQRHHGRSGPRAGHEQKDPLRAVPEQDGLARGGDPGQVPRRRGRSAPITRAETADFAWGLLLTRVFHFSLCIFLLVDDAHKSGGVTVSHLRFGPKPITSQVGAFFLSFFVLSSRSSFWLSSLF